MDDHLEKEEEDGGEHGERGDEPHEEARGRRHHVVGLRYDSVQVVEFLVQKVLSKYRWRFIF